MTRTLTAVATIAALTAGPALAAQDIRPETSPTPQSEMRKGQETHGTNVDGAAAEAAAKSAMQTEESYGGEGIYLKVREGWSPADFHVKRMVVDMVQSAYDAGDRVGEAPSVAGSDSDADELARQMENELEPGAEIPAKFETRDLPDRLDANLPHTVYGSEWHAIGDHLVEVDSQGEIQLVVYEVLA